MSFGFLVLAFVAALNPCRARLALPARPTAVALGAVLALAAGAALAAGGGSALEALDVSPESFRLAAGLVLALEGARTLVLPRPAVEPELPGLGAALVPVAFPILLQPGVLALGLAAGADRVGGEAVGALAAGLGVVVVGMALRVGTREQALLGAGARLLGALELAAGVALAVDAIRDV